MIQSTPAPQRFKVCKKLEVLLKTPPRHFRLIALIPVETSLASTLPTFVIGTENISESARHQLASLTIRKWIEKHFLAPLLILTSI